VRRWTSLLCFGVACAIAPAAPQLLLAGDQAPQQQPPPGPVPPPSALQFKELPEETTVTTPSGATFTVSRGWHLARRDDLIVIEEPQRELAAAFVEVVAPTASASWC